MDDTIDLREMAAALRRGSRWIIGGVLFGLVGAGAVTRVLEPAYEATATVVVRNESRSSFGSFPGPPGGGLLGLFSGAADFETELEILTSRAVVGAVVDSLGLQARIVEPKGLDVGSVFASTRFERELEEGRYRFERAGRGYRVTLPSGETGGEAVPGEPYGLDGAVVVLRPGELPESFEVELMDFPDVVRRIRKRLKADAVAGQMAEITFRAGDPVAAAAVPNAVVAEYVKRRKAWDRRVNEQRVAFLTQLTDSIRREVARAGEALRDVDAAEGTFDATRTAEIELAAKLKTELDELEVEARALDRILNREGGDLPSTAELAAYPTFLRNAAINDLLSRLFEIETNRRELLRRRTENDPEVAVLAENRRYLEQELLSLASAYREGVLRRQAQLRRELERYRTVLASQEEGVPLQADYRRLVETHLALESQLVQARLAAIAEGGEVLQVDTAQVPKRPAYPKPLLNLGIGLMAGLLVGVLGGLFRAYVGGPIEERWQAAVAVRVPVLELDTGTPLVVGRGGEAEGGNTVLVMPVGRGAESMPVARRIATTAALQGVDSVLVDLAGGRAEVPAAALELVALTGGKSIGSGGLPRVYAVGTGGQNGGGWPAWNELRQHVADLERRHSLVVAALPRLESAAATALLDGRRAVVLVVRAGQVRRAELQEMVEALGQLGVRVSSVVLQRGHGDGGSPA